MLGDINLYQYAPNGLTWLDPLGLAKCHFSGNRSRSKAKHNIKRNGYKIVAKEVTMIVNGSRVRADFVAVDKYGNSGLTKNQSKADVYNMNNPSNTASGIGGETIIPSAGTERKFKVATGNTKKTEKIGPQGTVHDATFHILDY